MFVSDMSLEDLERVGGWGGVMVIPRLQHSRPAAKRQVSLLKIMRRQITQLISCESEEYRVLLLSVLGTLNAKHITSSEDQPSLKSTTPFSPNGIGMPEGMRSEERSGRRPTLRGRGQSVFHQDYIGTISREKFPGDSRWSAYAPFLALWTPS